MPSARRQSQTQCDLPSVGPLRPCCSNFSTRWASVWAGAGGLVASVMRKCVMRFCDATLHGRCMRFAVLRAVATRPQCAAPCCGIRGHRGEGCPCHRTEAIEAETQQQRMRRLRRVFAQAAGGSRRSLWDTCPLSGKRAPEMATGDGLIAVRSYYRQAEARVIMACSSGGISPEDRMAVLADWHVGVSNALPALTMKLACWRTVPWMLAGLGHHSPAKAQTVAQACLAAYDRSPSASGHHRVSNEFLGPDGDFRGCVVRGFVSSAFDVRACGVRECGFVSTHCLGTGLAVLRAGLTRPAGWAVAGRVLPTAEAQMARGVPREALPESFQARVVDLKLMPIVERTIESRHAMVSKAVGHSTRSPVTVSLASGRLREFEGRVSADPAVFSEVARLLETVRNSRQQAEVLQLLDHPCVGPVWRHPPRLAAGYSLQSRIGYSQSHSQL